MIFPEAQSLELVRSIVVDEHTLEDVIDLEQEALAETGNIILNGCLATIANVLHRTMRMSLPSIVRGDGAALFEVEGPASGGQFVCFFILISTSRDGMFTALSPCSWICRRSPH